MIALLETDCPGTEAEAAGKAAACEGCPNQQICATAPKGPDPGTYSFSSSLEDFRCSVCFLGWMVRLEVVCLRVLTFIP